MAPPQRFVLVRPAGSRLSEGQTASGLRCHSSNCGPGPRPDPGRRSPRLHGVTGEPHSPGSPPGVALGWPSSPWAARSDLVEPPEETANPPAPGPRGPPAGLRRGPWGRWTLFSLFRLLLKDAYVKKGHASCVQLPEISPVSHTPVTQARDPNVTRARDPAVSLPVATPRPSGDDQTVTSWDLGSAAVVRRLLPVLNRLWLLALLCVAAADSSSPPCRSHRLTLTLSTDIGSLLRQDGSLRDEPSPLQDGSGSFP